MSSKAMALVKMAKITLERLENTNKTKYPSNTLIDYYDIIHKLLEAIASLKNKKFKGDGAHYELVEYSYTQNILTEDEKEFVQQARDFRNKIQYEGFYIQKEYIIRNEKKIKNIIKKLLSTF